MKKKILTNFDIKKGGVGPIWSYRLHWSCEFLALSHSICPRVKPAEELPRLCEPRKFLFPDLTCCRAIVPGIHLFFSLPDLSLWHKQVVLYAREWFNKYIKKRENSYGVVFGTFML